MVVQIDGMIPRREVLLDGIGKLGLAVDKEDKISSQKTIADQESKELLVCRMLLYMVNPIDPAICLDGHSYGNLMRVLVDSRQAGILGRDGEYGWDGWLGTYFANDPEDDATLLLGIQRYDYGTGPCTRKLRNIVFS
jgi:CubicO group peptidase (beta-lactamase class C family)